jgi:HlyD family secretion protein
LKKWVIVTAVVVVLAAVIVGSVVSSRPKGEKVYVETVKRKAIESIVSASGEIDPKVKVNISAHVVGKIEKLYFK